MTTVSRYTKPTIDLEEIYIGTLERGCKIELVDQDVKYPDTFMETTVYYIKVTEQNGVSYTVSLSTDHMKRHAF